MEGGVDRLSLSRKGLRDGVQEMMGGTTRLERGIIILAYEQK